MSLISLYKKGPLKVSLSPPGPAISAENRNLLSPRSYRVTTWLLNCWLKFVKKIFFQFCISSFFLLFSNFGFLLPCHHIRVEGMIRRTMTSLSERWNARMCEWDKKYGHLMRETLDGNILCSGGVLFTRYSLVPANDADRQRSTVCVVTSKRPRRP